MNRWVAWSVAALVGALAGDVMLRLRPPVRRQRVRLEDSGTTVAGPRHDRARARPPSSPQGAAAEANGGTSPGTPAAEAPAQAPRGEGSASSPAATAKSRGAEIVTGEAGSALLLDSETIVVGALAMREGTPVGIIHEKYKQQLRAIAEQDASLGPPPWEGDVFQVFGFIGSPTFAVLGRQVDLPASVEGSLAWYVKEWRLEPSEEARKRAASCLEDYEERDRALRVKIQERLLELARQKDPRGSGVSLYAVVNDRIHLIEDADAPGLDDFRTYVSGIQSGVLRRAAEAVR